MKNFIKNALWMAACTLVSFGALASDPPALHGMLVYGDQDIYLSHLPMFHSPHNYQVILKVEFDDDSKGLFPKGGNKRVYTIAPEPFVLPEMVRAGNSFKARLYQGHFEQGGVFLGDVMVLIEKVVYFEKLASPH